MQDSDRDTDKSVPGSGVWEKSDNSRWIVVAQGSHKIPRTRLASEGSVDPGLSIRTFISSFEAELPRVGENSSFVSDGSSMVRFDNPVGGSSETAEEDGGDGGSGVSQARNRKYRRQRRRKTKVVGGTGGGVSVESSPGRECPSPDSLIQIIIKHQHPTDFL